MKHLGEKYLLILSPTFLHFFSKKDFSFEFTSIAMLGMYSKMSVLNYMVITINNKYNISG